MKNLSTTYMVITPDPTHNLPNKFRIADIVPTYAARKARALVRKLGYSIKSADLIIEDGDITFIYLGFQAAGLKTPINLSLR